MADTSSVTAATQWPQVMPVTVQVLVDIPEAYPLTVGP
jgi:hypothetical protein